LENTTWLSHTWSLVPHWLFRTSFGRLWKFFFFFFFFFSSFPVLPMRDPWFFRFSPSVFGPPKEVSASVSPLGFCSKVPYKVLQFAPPVNLPASNGMLSPVFREISFFDIYFGLSSRFSSVRRSPPPRPGSFSNLGFTNISPPCWTLLSRSYSKVFSRSLTKSIPHFLLRIFFRKPLVFLIPKAEFRLLNHFGAP